MHICLVAPNDALTDPRARVSRYLLERAGNQVSVVLPVAGPEMPGVTRVVDPAPSLVDRIRRRREDREAKQARRARALAEAAGATGATVFMPTDPRALDAAVAAARASGGVVARTPKMAHVGDVDLIDLAPAHPELAAAPAGIGSFHTPEDRRAPYRPEPDRHRGRHVVLCYRKSEINPGRYLESALHRSGADVRVETEGIDLDRLDPATDLVVFVEAPYPALEVTGSTEKPILYWFHHGEHHLHANLRLIDHYRADAVLMAHSWHLAPWSPVPVHRFPFGVAGGLLDPSRRMADRRYDVAMVGAKLRSGGPYGRRQQLVAALEAALPPDRLGFREQVTADEMAALYGDARIVINEGGTRHYPITMRVLETVGSGAVLLSDHLPGMEMLLQPEAHYAPLGEDVVADVTSLLSDPQHLQEMADAALERAMGLHTYDHRVDELFEIAATTRKREGREQVALTGLAGLIDRDVEVQRVAQLGLPDLAGLLPSREVWDVAALEETRLAPGKMESVALVAESVEEHHALLRAARRYIYIQGAARGLEESLATEAPQAVSSRSDDLIRVDLMAPSYRIMPFEVETR